MWKKIFDNLYNGFFWLRDIVIWGQWTKWWDWMKLMHSASEDASSKRFWGGFLIFWSVVAFFLAAFGVLTVTVWDKLFTAWLIMLTSGLGLISLAVLDKILSLTNSLKFAQLEKDKLPNTNGV